MDQQQESKEQGYSNRFNFNTSVTSRKVDSHPASFNPSVQSGDWMDIDDFPPSQPPASAGMFRSYSSQSEPRITFPASDGSPRPSYDSYDDSHSLQAKRDFRSPGNPQPPAFAFGFPSDIPQSQSNTSGTQSQINDSERVASQWNQDLEESNHQQSSAYESSPQIQTEGQPKLAPVRVSKACVPCRNKRIKCSGGYPHCTSCIAKGIVDQCVYRIIPPRAVNRKALDELQSRIKRIENELQRSSEENRELRSRLWNASQELEKFKSDEKFREVTKELAEAELQLLQSRNSQSHPLPSAAADSRLLLPRSLPHQRRSDAPELFLSKERPLPDSNFPNSNDSNLVRHDSGSSHPSSSQDRAHSQDVQSQMRVATLRPDHPLDPSNMGVLSRVTPFMDGEEVASSRRYRPFPRSHSASVSSSASFPPSAPRSQFSASSSMAPLVGTEGNGEDLLVSSGHADDSHELEPLYLDRTLVGTSVAHSTSIPPNFLESENKYQYLDDKAYLGKVNLKVYDQKQKQSNQASSSQPLDHQPYQHQHQLGSRPQPQPQPKQQLQPQQQLQQDSHSHSGPIPPSQFTFKPHVVKFPDSDTSLSKKHKP